MSDGPTTLPTSVEESNRQRSDVGRAAMAPSWLRLCGWGLLASAAALVHNRLWASPNLGAFATIASSLGSDPFPGTTSSDYLMTNLSMPVLAGLSGFDAPHRYAALHLVVLVLGLAGCVALTARRFGHVPARTLVVLLAASPGVTVVMQWLGQPDALTFPLAIASALVRRTWAFGLVALALGLTHPEQAIVIVVVAAVVRATVLPDDAASAPPGVSPARAATTRIAGQLMAGWGAVIVARVVIELVLRMSDAQVGPLRSDYLRLGIDAWIEHHGRAPAAMVWFLWGPLWLVAAGVAWWRWAARDVARPGYGTAWCTLAALSLGAVVPVAVALDETRVYAMLTAPVLAAAAVLVGVEVGERRPRALRWCSVALLAVLLVVPGGFTAGAAARASQIPTGEFVEFLQTGDHPGDNMFLWLLSPFDFVFPDLDGL